MLSTELVRSSFHVGHTFACITKVGSIHGDGSLSMRQSTAAVVNPVVAGDIFNVMLNETFKKSENLCKD